MSNQDLHSYKKWKIGNDIRAWLLADSGITGYVSTNVFPLVAPENVEGDFIIYNRDKYSKVWTKMGVVDDVCEVFVTIVSDNYDRSVEIAEIVDKVITGEHTDTNKRIIADLVDSTETFDDFKYIQTLLFKIK